MPVNEPILPVLLTKVKHRFIWPTQTQNRTQVFRPSIEVSRCDSASVVSLQSTHISSFLKKYPNNRPVFQDFLLNPDWIKVQVFLHGQHGLLLSVLRGEHFGLNAKPDRHCEARQFLEGTELGGGFPSHQHLNGQSRKVSDLWELWRESLLLRLQKLETLQHSRHQTQSPHQWHLIFNPRESFGRQPSLAQTHLLEQLRQNLESLQPNSSLPKSKFREVRVQNDAPSRPVQLADFRFLKFSDIFRALVEFDDVWGS